MAEWTKEEMTAAGQRIIRRFDGVYSLELAEMECEVTALREALVNLRSIDECACLDNEDYCPHAVADRLLAKIPK